MLSTDPSYDIYYEGERVAFICMAPTMKSVDGFRFFNQSGDQVYELASYSHTIAWFQLTAAKASAMEYTCMYWVKDAGREVLSNRSLPLSIKVQGTWVLCCLYMMLLRVSAFSQAPFVLLGFSEQSGIG